MTAPGWPDWRPELGVLRCGGRSEQGDTTPQGCLEAVATLPAPLPLNLSRRKMGMDSWWVGRWTDR